MRLPTGFPRTFRHGFLMSASLLACVVMFAPPAAGDDQTVLIADQILMPDGSLASGKAIVISGGKIDRIAPADEFKDDQRAHRYDNAVICPGLIEVLSSLGIGQDNVSRKNLIDPRVAVIDGVDRESIDLRRALEAGVTAAMVLPAPTDLVPGRAATIRTAAPDSGARVLRPFGPLSIVLSSSAWNPNREPSSRAGALALLRDALSKAESDASAAPALREVVRGKGDVVVTCETAADVSAALRLLDRYGVTPVIAHTKFAREIADEIAAANAMIIVGPLTFESDQPTLLGPAALERAGVELSLRGGIENGDPDGLRISAALAVIAGLSPEAARRSITANPARVAGVSNQIGALRAGLSADLVIFTGDPLRLDSDVREVWIAGERVYASSHQTYDFDRVIGATDD